MWVILAHAGDVDAYHLAGRWPDAYVLTPRDLSRAGWRHMPSGPVDPATERAVVAGRIVAAGEIEVVLTRLDGVTAADLAHIVAEERDYVAAEMNAFLLSWLTRLTCPVVNAPVPLGLAGVSHRPEGWAVLAAGLGLPFRPQRRASGGYLAVGPRSQRSVTLIGDHCFGDPDSELWDGTRRLARAAGLDVVTAVYDGDSAAAGLCAAYPWPDITIDGVPRALEDLLRDRARSGRAS